MRLLPEDLGTKWHIALVRHRAYGPAIAWSRPVEPRIGRLGRVWTRGMGLKEEVAAATLPMASGETEGYLYGLGFGLGWIPPAAIVAAFFTIHNPALLVATDTAALGLAGALSWWAGVSLPRRALHKLHKTPIRPDEVEMLRTSTVPGMPPFLGQMATRFFRLWNRGVQETTTDALEQGFLALALEVVRNESIPESAQEDLRATLRALGDAILSLPPPHEPEIASGTIAAADLRGDAEMLFARAARESDAVIAASLKRQADALLERALAAENNGVIARRTQVLRDELRAQIDALRAALPTFGRAASATASAAVDTGAFSRLAQSVRGVATEAAAVAAAHEELNEISPDLAARRLDTDAETGSVEVTWTPSGAYRGVTDEAQQQEPQRIQRGG